MTRTIEDMAEFAWDHWIGFASQNGGSFSEWMLIRLKEAIAMTASANPSRDDHTMDSLSYTTAAARDAIDTSSKLYGGITAAQHKEIAERVDRLAHQMFYLEKMRAFGQWAATVGAGDMQEPTQRERFFSWPSADQASEMMVKNAEEVGRKIGEVIDGLVLGKTQEEIDAIIKAHRPEGMSVADSWSRALQLSHGIASNVLHLATEPQRAYEEGIRYAGFQPFYFSDDLSILPNWGQMSFGVKAEMRRQEDYRQADIPLPVWNWNTWASIGDTLKWRRECFDRYDLRIAMRSFDNFIAGREEPITATSEEGCVFQICCGRGIDLPKTSNDNKHDLWL